MADYAAILTLYDRVCAAAEIERKGKGSPYTSSNGYMFSSLNKAGELGIRLPKDRQKELAQTHGAGPFKSYGATMRDYVCLTERMLADEKLIVSLLKESLTFVEAMPPGKKK